MHLYQEGDCTHYKQPIINCNISKCWQQVLQQSDYETRKAEVIKYNRWAWLNYSPLIPIEVCKHFNIELNGVGAYNVESWFYKQL